MSASVLPSDAAGAARRYRALLIDFDGTIADSLAYLRAVYEGFVRGLGGTPSELEFEALNGVPLADVVRAICDRHAPEESHDVALDRYVRRIDEGFEAVPVLPGADALLRDAAGSGLTCGIVTSNSKARVEAWLKEQGLAELCFVLVSGDDALRGKPAPDPYRVALDRLGLAPGEAIAIEDSAAGAASAHAAGLATIKLGGPADGALAPPLHVAADLAEAAALLARLNRL